MTRRHHRQRPRPRGPNGPSIVEVAKAIEVLSRVERTSIRVLAEAKDLLEGRRPIGFTGPLADAHGDVVPTHRDPEEEGCARRGRQRGSVKR